MQFSIAAISLIAGFAAAAPALRALDAYEEKALEKRVLDPLSIAIIAGIVSGVVSTSAAAATTKSIPLIGNITNWTQAREAFTKSIVKNMIKSAKSNEAAICCNVGYSVSNESKKREFASVEFRSGPLHTDYDCFLYSGPGTFQLEGDGGFINIAIQDGPCSYDSGLLTCP